MDLSEAYPELLDLVAQKHIHYYEDYLDFSCVSKSWHSVAVQAVTKVSYSNGLPSRFPSLLFGEKIEDSEFRQLFFFSNNSTRKIRLPEAYGKFWVSSSGWLLTAGEWLLIIGGDYSPKLINPLSRETLDLPNTIEHLNYDDGIRKVLFSSQSPVVVVLWGSTRLGFCCIGNDNWTFIKTSWNGAIQDITYYDGRVYYLDVCYRIKSRDAHGNDLVTVDVSRLPKCFHSKELELGYILGLDDERKKLLVVIRELLTILTEDVSDGHKVHRASYKTKNFRVFEYDLENGKWTKVNDLGIKSLFVGFSSSFCVEDNSGVIKGNCIYYTHHKPLSIHKWATNGHDKLYRNKNSETGAEWDMGIYHMCDGAIEPYLIGKSCSEMTPPIWLQSM